LAEGIVISVVAACYWCCD